MGKIRQAIIEDQYPAFLHKFFSDIYGGDKSKFPEWAVGALRGVGVDLLADSWCRDHVWSNEKCLEEKYNENSYFMT